VCSAALILAAAGILEGVPATTHGLLPERLRTFGALPQHIEIRTGWVIADPAVLKHLPGAQPWKGLKSVVKGHARHEVIDQVTEKDRYLRPKLIENLTIWSK
jgi:hypothetical protein